MTQLKVYYKLYAVLFFLVAPLVGLAQDKISVSLYQDSRLLFLGDDSSNKAGTIDLLARFKIYGNQSEYGYFTLNTEYEQANIQEVYKRISLNVGYTFTTFYIRGLHFTDNIELTTTFGYGKIYRHSNNTNNWSVTGEVAYNLNEWLQFGIINQFTKRTDLMYKYQTDTIRYSVFFGFEFKIFQFDKRPVCYSY